MAAAKKNLDGYPVEEVETFYHDIKFELTDKELLKYGTELSLLQTKLKQIEKEKKDAMEVFKTSTDNCKSSIDTLSKKIMDKSEKRPVKVYWRYHHPEMSKQSMFNYETKELIEVIDMIDNVAKDSKNKTGNGMETVPHE